MADRAGDFLRHLGYRNAFCLDTEFAAPTGRKPVPVCLVAKCLITGKEIRLWADALRGPCPFDVSDDDLFIAYYASAEFTVFDVLGWPRPRRVIDLFPEFRCLTNGVGPLFGNGLIGALLHYNLSTIGGDEKEDMRKLVIADTDEVGHAFQYDVGHLFRSEAGHHSEMKPATRRLLPQVWIDDVSSFLIGQERMDFIRTKAACEGFHLPDRSDRHCG